jgi:hypothetical protein
MYYLQYLCQYQPVFRDVDTPYWDWASVAGAALGLLQSGRRVVRILDANGGLVGDYDRAAAGRLMGGAGTAPGTAPGAMGTPWA